MKPILFKCSLLTVGVIAAMSLTTANAAEVAYSAENAFSIKNKATATYTVADNATEQQAESNEVTVNVTETGAFSLVATLDDGAAGDDLNEDIAINPQSGSTVDFTHRLANDGNVADTYTITLANPSNSLPATATIKYQKKDAGGTNVGNVETINIGGSIALEAGQSADMTITATTGSDRVIGSNTSFTVAATSAYLTAKGQTGANRRAVNTDNAITTTPVYAITKSATTNLGNKTFDVNNANAYVDYTVNVKNEGNIDGTAVTIVDTLPAALIAIQSGGDNYTAPTVISSNGVATQSAVISSDGKTITVTGQNIAKDEIITLTFRVKKDATNPVSGTNIVNYAVVKDDVNGDGTFDLVDSSDDAADSSVSERNYENATGSNYKGKDNNSAATIITSSQTRELAISTGQNKETALISDNTYTYTITNNGTDITEAQSADEVFFTVNPTTNDDNITIGTVFVDVDKSGTFNTGDIELNPDASGNYDLSDAVVDGLAPEKTVEISVQVTTNGTGSNLTTNNIGNSETMTITVLPQGVVAGTPAPANVNTTSKTTMQGLNLLKYQAVAACSADLTALNWVDTPISGNDAKPGNCIYYKITAENTFTDSSKRINNIVVTDELATPKITYQNDFSSETSGSSPAATANYSASILTGTFASLAASETGTVYFSAKISQTGANASP